MIKMPKEQKGLLLVVITPRGQQLSRMTSITRREMPTYFLMFIDEVFSKLGGGEVKLLQQGSNLGYSNTPK